MKKKLGALEVINMGKRGLIELTGVFVSLLFFLPGQSLATDNASTVLIRNASLIDGRGGPVQSGVDLLIKSGKIYSIASGSESSTADIVIDASGKTVIPGLIDVHTHLHFPVVFQKTEAEKKAIIAHTPSAFLYNGVTTVLNVGSDADWIFDLRARQRAGYITGPRIYALGHGFTPEGGWGSRHGGSSSDPDLIRKKIRHYRDALSDGLKVIIEDGLGEGSGLYKEMPESMLQTIVTAARDNNLSLYLHAIGLPEYRRAVAAKPRAIVHGLEDVLPEGDPLIDDLLENDIAVVPTLSLFKSFLGPDPQAGKNLDHPVLLGSVPAFLLEKMRRKDYMKEERARFSKVARMNVYDWAARANPVFCENVRLMHKAGVKIGVGTDAGGTVGFNYQGYNTPFELKNLVECGLTEMEAIKAATINGAEIIGVADELGTLEAGKRADLLILSADPLQNIENIRQIEWVMQGGVVYPRQEFAYRRP